jgi:hypothetical protein
VNFSRKIESPQPWNLQLLTKNQKKCYIPSLHILQLSCMEVQYFNINILNKSSAAILVCANIIVNRHVAWGEKKNAYRIWWETQKERDH